MKNKLTVFAVSILCAAHAIASASAQELSAREIAERTKNRPGYIHDEVTALAMDLINSSGQTRSRRFLRYQGKTGNGKDTLIKFLAPADIENTGTLNIEVRDDDDTQYLYLPAARKLRRISTANKDQSWVGSDFSFEDLEELDLDKFDFGLDSPEVIEGHDCFKYWMKPKDEDDSIYGKQVHWVKKQGFLPIRADYYEKDGTLLKRIFYRDLRDTSKITYAWTIVVENVKDSHRTELRREWLLIDTGLPEHLLSTRQLEAPISNYKHPGNLWQLLSRAPGP
ncbi:MAG: outer membrane lipoprotein-sorting protein [Deltaproteobacteria bacterium]|nr:outer membrane lipoprotein-sorting protein [Deltaproteobacteria bacterium]